MANDVLQSLLDGAKNVAAPLVKLIVFEGTKLGLREAMEKEPQHTRVALVSFYPIVDVEIENRIPLEAELGRAVVSGIKEGIEAVAAEFAVILTNLDED